MPTIPHMVAKIGGTYICTLMDLQTQLRLALRLPFPLLVGKVVDVVRKRRSRSNLRRMVKRGELPHPITPTWSMRHGIMPLPSVRWRDDYRERVLVYARAYVAHKYSILGVDGFTFNGWSYDPVSFHHWPDASWYTHYAPVAGAEIKQPLELGRLHHLPQLALAAVLDPTFARTASQEVARGLVDFITANPVAHGIQWCSGIDVGIRAFSCCVAWDWLRSNGHELADVEPMLCASLADHAVFLMQTLEWAGGMRTSHYLANLLGVLAVGTYLHGHPQSATWRSFAIAELEREIDVQFLADGSGFEASTCYHRHTADIIEQATVLMGKDASPQWMQRRAQILRVLDALTIEDEIWPMIGDNDDGLALKLIGNEPLPLIHTPVGKAERAARWTLDLGLTTYVRPAFQVDLRCGGIGQHGKGGHAHNDQLSITLRVHGRPFIVDPGIPSYTMQAQERNAFRSTRMHNTLAPEGMEQNDWPSDDGEGLFWMMGDRAKACVEHCDDHQWSAHHVGFGVPHRRSVKIDPDGITGNDTWEGSRNADVLFHCHPSCEVTMHGTTATIRQGTTSCELAWTDATGSMEDYICALRYGRRATAPCIVLRLNGPSCTWTLRSFATA